MTQAALAALISLMCQQPDTNSRIYCFEKLVNCGVKLTGPLTKQEFIDQCSGTKGATYELYFKRLTDDFERN
jgi:hypothetical protein